MLKIDRLTVNGPADADATVLDLYKGLLGIKITDLPREVDDKIGFSGAFTHLRTGILFKDRIGLLNLRLAEGLNLGLSKMAKAKSTHGCFQPPRLSRWQAESKVMARTLPTVNRARYIPKGWGGSPST